MVLNKFYLLIAFLFGTCLAIAQPPAPPGPTLPPPPGLPIDENILTMMLVALLFGIYIIYNFKIKQKTPM
ncbi:hypothetical protein [Flavobacterium psychrolimnae]|nr:hypothetical protein [Flavobacterium psychrolimnae]